VDRFLEERAPGWARADANERSALAERLTPALAEIVARRINAAVVINPINLLAIAIVDAPHHALDERLLCQQLDVLKAMGAAARVSPRAIVTGMEPAEVIACGERLGAVSRFAHPLGDIIRVAPEQLALLTYFRNNVLHAFALPGLAVSLLGRREAVTADDIAQSALGLLPFLRAELFLDLSDDEVGATVVRLLALLAERGLVERTGESGFRAPEPNTVEAYRLELLARSQRQMLERHYLVQAVLAGFGPDRLTRERLVELVCLLGQRLTLLFESATPEFYERTAFASYVDTLACIGLIKENADGRLSFDQHLMAPARLLESLLPPDVLQAIRRVTRDRPDA
jgi:glycerol-3-phosphate O-acyltransferase